MEFERVIVTASKKTLKSQQNSQNHVLADANLLANLLEQNMAYQTAFDLSQMLLLHYGGLHGLVQLSVEDLRTFGFDNISATKLIIAIEIGKRLSTYRNDERPIIKNAFDAAQLMLDMRHLSQEHIRVILLDNAQRVIAIPTVYIGTVNAAVLRTAEIYKEAIIRNAPAMILVHNHPSGNASPSPEDVELTHALIQAGKLLDIVFVDHIIIGGEDWCSLKELQLGF